MELVLLPLSWNGQTILHVATTVPFVSRLAVVGDGSLAKFQVLEKACFAVAWSGVTNR